MERRSKTAGAGAAVFIALLLPAVVAFWVILSGALAGASRVDAMRSLAAIMNQADRLADDLDLELSFLDSIFIEGPDALGSPGDGSLQGAADRVSDSLAAYRQAARWPELVESVYVVEATGADALSRLPVSGMTRVLRVERSVQSDGAAVVARFRALVAVLDPSALASTVFPELAAGYFGPGSGFDEYAVSLRDGSGALMFSTADPGDPGADFSRPLLRDAGRFDVARFYLSFAPRLGAGENRSGAVPVSPPPDPSGGGASAQSSGLPPGSLPPIDRYRFLSDGSGAWTVEVIHRGVTIAEAARRESVIWSAAAGAFLAVLYGSVIALYLSSRRTAELAARERAFVASVTHELKTPIAVTLSAGENLEKGIVPPDRVAAYGGTVAREARRLGDSVERMLTVAGLESAQPFRHGEPVPLKDVADGVIAALSAYASGRGASFELAVDGSPTADGSRTLVESAVECVLGNAVKYAGGVIRVSLAETRRGGRRLATIRCSDSGPGMSRADRARAFEPFWRGKAALDAGIQGTGVGLYLARRVARLHGGDATVRCPPEGGTVVELRFRSYV